MCFQLRFRTLLEAVKSPEGILRLRDHNLFTDILDLNCDDMPEENRIAVAKSRRLIERIMYGPRFEPIAAVLFRDADEFEDSDQVIVS